MGLIINPRGSSGSGKTELVLRILGEYGWTRNSPDARSGIRPIYREGRSEPFAYRLQHPWAERPLIVLGHYLATSGGCDTICAQDGGCPRSCAVLGSSRLKATMWWLKDYTSAARSSSPLPPSPLPPPPPPACAYANGGPGSPLLPMMKSPWQNLRQSHPVGFRGGDTSSGLIPSTCPRWHWPVG